MMQTNSLLWILALIWESVYTVSYGCAAWRDGRKAGGIAVWFLAALPVAVCLFFALFPTE